MSRVVPQISGNAVEKKIVRTHSGRLVGIRRTQYTSAKWCTYFILYNIGTYVIILYLFLV
jgi:hypothetical protein